MKELVAKIALLTILVVIFSVGTILAPLALLFRPSTTFRAMNRLCGAAWLGFDGKNTISKECGLHLAAAKAAGRRPCSFCKRLCSILNLGDPSHCEKEAA